jgi:hypothetical protein
MNVGHAAVPLTTDRGEPLGGYADRQGGALGQLDELQLHATVFADGDATVAVVCTDLICVNTDAVAATRAAVATLGVEHCWVVATHTHAGPDTGCRPGGGTTPPRWIEGVAKASLTAVRRALESLVETSGQHRRVLVAGVGAVRAVKSEARVPYDVVSVHGRGGDIVGLIVVQPVHPTVLPAANRAVSADLAGSVRRALMRKFPGVWVVVLTGAAGDISTRGTRVSQDWAECERLGRIGAEEVVAGLVLPSRTAWSTGSLLAWTGGSVDLRAAPSRPSAAVDCDSIDDVILEDASLDPWEYRVRHTEVQGARIAAELSRSSASTYAVALEILRLGEFQLAGIAGEPFLALGERISAAMVTPTVVVGYANGYVGYLPAAAAFAERTYEVLASPVGPDAEQVIVEAFQQAEASITMRKE